MLLLPLALLLGVLVGWVAGGRPGRLAGVRLRWASVAIGALALQALLSLPASAGVTGGPRLALLAVSYAAAGGWLLLNIPGRPRAMAAGLAVTAVGWLLNMCVVLANTGMPVSVAALGRAGLGAGALSGGGPLGKHLAIGSGTVLGWLGDVIPVSFLRTVVSLGDLVMLGGIVLAVAAATRLPRVAGAAAARAVPSGVG